MQAIRSDKNEKQNIDTCNELGEGKKKGEKQDKGQRKIQKYIEKQKLTAKLLHNAKKKMQKTKGKEIQD